MLGNEAYFLYRRCVGAERAYPYIEFLLVMGTRFEGSVADDRTWQQAHDMIAAMHQYAEQIPELPEQVRGSWVWFRQPVVETKENCW